MKKQKTQTKLSVKTAVIIGIAIIGTAGLAYAVASTVKLDKNVESTIKAKARTMTTKKFQVSDVKNPMGTLKPCDVVNELKKYYPMASRTVTSGSYGEGPYSFYLKSITVTSTQNTKNKITGATAKVYYKKKWGETTTYYNEWKWTTNFFNKKEGYFSSSRSQRKVTGSVPSSSCNSANLDQGSTAPTAPVAAPINSNSSSTGSTSNPPAVMTTNLGYNCTGSSDQKTTTCKSSYFLKPVSGKGGVCPSDNTGMAFLVDGNCTGLNKTKTTPHSMSLMSTYSSIKITLKTNFSNYTAIWYASSNSAKGNYIGSKSEFDRLELSNIKKVGNSLNYNTVFNVGEKYDTFKETPLELITEFNK